MATAAAPATIGEAVAGMSRVTLTLKAAVVQIVLVGYFVLYGRSFQDTDPLFYSRLPWRVPLAVSWFACIWLFFLMLGYIELFLPRMLMAVHDALRWVGAVVGLVVIIVGGGVLGLSARVSVVVGCTCFMALIIAGLLVVWRWLVREYGGEASDMCTEKHSEVVTTDDWHIYQPPV